jgi:hypothetical protein
MGPDRLHIQRGTDEDEDVEHQRLKEEVEEVSNSVLQGEEDGEEDSSVKESTSSTEGNDVTTEVETTDSSFIKPSYIAVSFMVCTISCRKRKKRCSYLSFVLLSSTSSCLSLRLTPALLSPLLFSSFLGWFYDFDQSNECATEEARRLGISPFRTSLLSLPFDSSHRLGLSLAKGTFTYRSPFTSSSSSLCYSRPLWLRRFLFFDLLCPSPASL